MKEATKEIRAKLKMHIQSADIMHSNLEHVVLNAMLGMFAVLAFCYVFFLGNMVVNIVERRTLESQARTLADEVSDLELTYLATSNTIDVDLSYSLGFEEIKPNFATRKPLTAHFGFGSLPLPTGQAGVGRQVTAVSNEL